MIPLDPEEAWANFCELLRTVGTDIAGDGFTGANRSRAEGYRYLGGLIGFALEWYVDRRDTAFPAFVVCENEVLRWGAPNTDNLYCRSHVAPDGVYRISANVKGLRDLIISTHEGEMQQGQMAIYNERNLAQMQVGQDGDLELILGGERQPGNWMALDPNAEYVLVRQYVSDWVNDVAVRFDIERVGFEGATPSPPTDAEVARGIADAGAWIEATVRFWNDYSRGLASRLPPNVLAPPAHPPGGARDIAYGMGTYDLDDDQALIIECEVPEAKYWSFQLLSLGWFECHDLRGMCSLSGHQIRADADGRFRIVVAHTDPGVDNWLSTDGRTQGLVNYRFMLASTFPAPETTLLPFGRIRTLLPPGTPVVSQRDRRNQLAKRQEAVARRFR